MNSGLTFSQTRLNTLSHGYVTEQAMDLLRNSELGSHYIHSDMETHFNPANVGEFYNKPFQHSSIKGGTFIEDNTEIMYDIGGCLGYCQDGFTSTHFWDADYSDDHPWIIGCDLCECEYKNALQKAFSYFNGNLNTDDDSWLILSPPVFNWIYKNSNKKIGVKVSFNYQPPYRKSIIDVYKEPNNMIVKAAWTIPYNGIPDSSIYFAPNTSLIQFLRQNTLSGNLDTNDLRNQIKGICWEIVGRICHLYEDMGTPAHAHNDAHGGNDWGCLGGYDWYERDYLPIHYADVNWIDAQNAGGYIDLIRQHFEGPWLRTSMYIMNQLGDRFPSNDANGDNSIHLNLPFDSAFVYQQIVPIYIELNNQGVGYLKEEYWADPDFYRYKILHTSYLYSIRMVAGFLDFVYHEFGLDTMCFPKIRNLEQSTVLPPEGNTIITCNLQHGYPIGYNFTVITNDPTVTLTPQGNKAIITRGLQNKGDRQPDMSIKVTCQVMSNCGNSERDTINLALSAYNTTCPWVYVYNDNYGWVADNNILNQSKLPENIGKEVLDKYILREIPSTSNNMIKLNLVEIGNDSTIINSIKLYAVDHNPGTILGVTSTGELVLYDSLEVLSTDFATMTVGNRGRGEEITKEIQYDNLDSTNVGGDSTNQIKAKYNSSNSNGIGIIIGSQIDGIRDPQTYCNISSNLNSGKASLTSDATAFSSDFINRWEFSNSIIPVTGFNPGNTDMNLNIDWNIPYKMQYAAVANLNYSPDYNLSECLIIKALKNGYINVVPEVYNQDSLSSYISPTSNIELAFAKPYSENQRVYSKRDYLLEINGQIVTINGRMRVMNNTPKQNNSSESPKINKMHDCYPNPFNPTTKISYIIGKPEMVSIAIYDIIGRVVKTLVNEYKFPGSYIVEFDGSNLSSGVYFYRFKAGNITTVKKMMLIK
jgi:hypothetical protein